MWNKLEEIPILKKGGIHIKKKNRGKFTESANIAGMGVQEFANHVLANKDKYSPTLVKRANFARNAKKFKHENDGILKAQGGTRNLFSIKPGSPLDQAWQAANEKLKYPGVKQIVGPDGNKVAIRTEGSLKPVYISEYLPGTGDLAEAGYVIDDIKNKRYGTAMLAAGLTLLPGNAGKLLNRADNITFKVTDLNGIKKVNVTLEDPSKYWYVAHQTGSNNFPSIYQNGLRTGSGLNGTATHVNQEFLNNFANGKLKQVHMSHEGADGLVVMKFPKSDFPSPDLDDISIRLMDLGKSKAFEVPSEYMQFFKRDQFKRGGKL